MRTGLQLLATASVAALLTVGLAPAATASVSYTFPPDCTLTPAGTDGDTVTCTARPPTQTWHLGIYCTYWVKPSLVAGNKVTGNGTSVAHCLFGLEPDGAVFVIDS
jgi:hypothetical protein